VALTPAAIAVRKRLFEDFEFYAEKCLKIRTKKQQIVPFVLNRAQQRLLELVARQLASRGYVRIIILKARQMGLSTLVGGFLYWWVSQRRVQKAIVVAHKSDATRNLFGMTKQFHDAAPVSVKPSTKYSSRKELVFDKLESSYLVETAGGDGIARSNTLSCAHLSELAFWPPGVARDNFSGLMDTIPTEPGTIVIIESTANGVSGLYYDQYQTAVRGEGNFERIFLPWFIQDEYRMPVPADFERTPDEIEMALAALRDFSEVIGNDQLCYRRSKVAEKGLDLFKQEYPANETEAFLTSGRPVFIPEMISKLIENAPPPIARKGLEAGTWENHSHGELHCYLPHDPGGRYYIGADVGAGVNRDWSVAQVLDSAGRQAAVYRAQIDPDSYATTLASLGKYFNDAEIIPESNNHGILTCVRLSKDLDYPNVFTETVYDKISDQETTKIGFFTSVKSKPLVIDKLRAALRDGTVTIFDKTTLEEMRSYIVTETGKMQAEPGCHDDCVMALALANHINEGEWVPTPNQDSWFVKMI
jgi:hypothetical protein